MCVCVCVCVRVRACVRAFVRACVRVLVGRVGGWRGLGNKFVYFPKSQRLDNCWDWYDTLKMRDPSPLLLISFIVDDARKKMAEWHKCDPNSPGL